MSSKLVVGILLLMSLLLAGTGTAQATSVVTVDGVTYTPTSVADSKIVVNIPALTTTTADINPFAGAIIPD